MLEKQDILVGGHAFVLKLKWQRGARGNISKTSDARVTWQDSWSRDHEQGPTRLVFVIPFFCPIFFSPMYRCLTSLLFITRSAGWCAASLPLSFSRPDPLNKNQLLDTETPARDFKDSDQSWHELSQSDQWPGSMIWYVWVWPKQIGRECEKMAS